MAEISIREMMESKSYHQAKELLNKEINSQIIVVDRSVFEKTPEEKDRLKDMKEDNKIARKKEYGVNYKKYLNTSENSITTLKIEGFIIPNGIIITERLIQD